MLIKMMTRWGFGPVGDLACSCLTGCLDTRHSLIVVPTTATWGLLVSHYCPGRIICWRISTVVLYSGAAWRLYVTIWVLLLCTKRPLRIGATGLRRRIILASLLLITTSVCITTTTTHLSSAPSLLSWRLLVPSTTTRWSCLWLLLLKRRPLHVVYRLYSHLLKCWIIVHRGRLVLGPFLWMCRGRPHCLHSQRLVDDCRDLGLGGLGGWGRGLGWHPRGRRVRNLVVDVTYRLTIDRRVCREVSTLKTQKSINIITISQSKILYGKYIWFQFSKIPTDREILNPWY